MSRPLTQQQQVVYDFIRDKITTRGYGPTVREIGEHMNIRSPNGVMCHLRALERKGMITRAANKSRAIELTEPIPRESQVHIPLCGTIQQADCHLSRQDSSADFDPSDFFEGDDKFALQVLDDSLNDLSIRRGDVLIVQRGLPPHVGQLCIVHQRDQVFPQLVRVMSVDGEQIQWQTIQRTFVSVQTAEVEWQGQVICVVRRLV